MVMAYKQFQSLHCSLWPPDLSPTPAGSCQGDTTHFPHTCTGWHGDTTFLFSCDTHSWTGLSVH